MPTPGALDWLPGAELEKLELILAIELLAQLLQNLLQLMMPRCSAHGGPATGVHHDQAGRQLDDVDTLHVFLGIRDKGIGPKPRARSCLEVSPLVHLAVVHFAS